MSRGGRITLALVLILALMICGLAAGTVIGGRFFVKPGSGLAGPAIALGYGALGAGLGLVIGIVLAATLPPKPLIATALPIIIVGAGLAVLIGKGYLASRAQSEAHLQQAYAKLNKFTVTMTVLAEDGAAGLEPMPFKTLKADWGQRRYTATFAGKKPQSCTAELSGREAVALLTALRNVEGLLLKNPDPCAGASGAVLRRLEFVIPEVRPPDNRGIIAIDAVCARRHPALVEPFTAAAKIYHDGDHRKICN